MTFGINTFLFTSPFTTLDFHLLEKCRDWGFDSVEVAVEEVSHIDGKALKKALGDNGLVCASTCGVTGPGRDLRGSQKEQQATLDYMKALLDLMAEIDSPVCLGPIYSSVGRAEMVAKDEHARQWELVVRHLHNLSVYAQQRNAKIALEPLNRYETDFINTAEQVMNLVRDVNHDHIGVLLDTYHMNIEEKDAARAIRHVGDRLFHFHACGCDRGTPGNDHINWDPIVAALEEVKYGGSVVIESFSTEVKVIAKAASIWRQFEPSREDIAIKGLKFLKSKFK
jgi:D-psicose/D-tagatose/L-ribulose 3-epimerase